MWQQLKKKAEAAAARRMSLEAGPPLAEPSEVRGPTISLTATW